MNWSYYSHYVGDIFGAPLAIEGLMAFFLEATFVGLFFFGWDRLSQGRPPGRHLAGGARLQLLGAVDPDRQRLDAESGRRRVQSRHHAHGGHRLRARCCSIRSRRPSSCTPSPPAMSPARSSSSAISAWYLLQAATSNFAKRSMAVAASFGLASALSVVVLGDESGYVATEHQKMKIAAIEAMWHTEPAPARLHHLRHPGLRGAQTHCRDPDSLGARPDRHALARRARCPASSKLVEHAKARIAGGIAAYAALQRLRADPQRTASRARQFEEHWQDLGYGLLLQSAISTTPPSDGGGDRAGGLGHGARMCRRCSGRFRIMVGLGFFFIALLRALRSSCRRAARRPRAAGSCGSRSSACRCPGSPPSWAGSSPNSAGSPGSIEGVLPTFLGVSGLSAANVMAVAHRLRAVLHGARSSSSVCLMLGMIRRGPDGLRLLARRALDHAGVRRHDAARHLDYETLRLIWWLLLGVLLIGFAVMDGFDLGVGALLPFVGRDRRRAPRRAQHHRPGLGRQPGLVHPRRRRDLRRLAAALCGVASPASTSRCSLILVALILRPVGFKFRAKIDDPRWRTVWDWALFVGGVVPRR